MKRFRYQGPVASVTLQARDYNLHPGAEVELPDGNDYVRTLLAKGFLTPLPASATADRQEPKVARKPDKDAFAPQEKP